jgi:hypothetical protein
MLNLDKDNMCFFTIYIVNRSLGLKFLTNNTQKKYKKSCNIDKLRVTICVDAIIYLLNRE